MVHYRFIHFNNMSDFQGKKLGADLENKTYTIGTGTEIKTGEPEIPYDSIVFIKDEKKIWTHGCLYAESSSGPLQCKTTMQNNTLKLTCSDNSSPEIGIVNMSVNIFDITIEGTVNKNFGKEITLLFKNTSSSTYEVQIPASRFITPDGKAISFEVPSQGYQELSLLSDGTNFYVRTS